MAVKKKVSKKPKKAKGIVGELNEKIHHNRERASELNKKFEKELKVIAKNAGTAPKSAKKITVLLTEMEKAGKKVSGGSEMVNEDIAIKLTSLYFQEVARTGFKKSLTLSEIINAYQYVLGRLGPVETIQAIQGPAVKETIIRQETVSKDADNLMENIEKLKASIDADALKKLPERTLGGFAYTNKKGVTYYLHQRGKLYFFSKDPMHAIDKPENMFVVENKQTGLPLVKKK
ncbi:MAG: hypothetical protein NT067_04115 [Candidatus Diapherotrites archaeon]|nr:hypothetical protein [Candidatus Diapherotrites archaeon]